MIDPNVESVRELMLKRAAAGKAHYKGKDTTRPDYTALDWLRELQAELCDGAVYAEALGKAIEALMGDKAMLDWLAERWQNAWWDVDDNDQPVLPQDAPSLRQAIYAKMEKGESK